MRGRLTSGGGVVGGDAAARRSSRSSLTHSISIALVAAARRSTRSTRSSLTHSISIALTPSTAAAVSVGHSMDCAPSLVAIAIQRLDPAFARLFLPPRAAQRAL